jgi:hypothetical protein
MNSDLTTWLETAHAKLAPRAKEIVHEQILEHFTAASERYLLEGKPLLEAQALAIIDLGDASVAAKKWELVHLTDKELEVYQILFTKTKKTPLILPLISLSLGLIQFYVLSNSIATAGIFISLSLWHLTRITIARISTLRRFILLDLIFGMVILILNLFFVYQMYQLPFLRQYSVYIGVLFSLLLLGLLLFLPKQISRLRKLESL